MENNIQQKNEILSKQTNIPQQNKKLTVFFVLAIILSLLINIGIFSHKLIQYQELTSNCQAQKIAQKIASDLSCGNPGVKGEIIIVGIEIIIIAVFSLIFWLMWKKNNISRYKKLLIIYIILSITIFLLINYFILTIFRSLYE